MTIQKELFSMDELATLSAADTANDGPVSQVKAYYDSLEKDLRAGTMTRKDALAGAIAKGIKVATATSQYGTWARAKNLKTVRAKPEYSASVLAKRAAAKAAPKVQAKAAVSPALTSTQQGNTTMASLLLILQYAPLIASLIQSVEVDGASGPDKLAAVLLGLQTQLPDVFGKFDLTKLKAYIGTVVMMYNTFHPLFKKNKTA